MSENRWGIYIDIEGFSHKFVPRDSQDEDQEAKDGRKEDLSGLMSLGALMDGIYRIGANKYNNDTERLFAHQIGDGFVIVSCFPEADLGRPLAVAIALMRHVLIKGGVAKASIAEGSFGDYLGCYPEPIVENQREGRLSMGRGLMTIFPVMGTALINCVGVGKRSPSGSLLTLEKDLTDRIPCEFEVTEIENGLVSINWLRGDSPLVNDIAECSKLCNPEEKLRILKLNNYIENNELPAKWVQSTRSLLDIEVESNCEPGIPIVL